MDADEQGAAHWGRKGGFGGCVRGGFTEPSRGSMWALSVQTRAGLAYVCTVDAWVPGMVRACAHDSVLLDQYSIGTGYVTLGIKS